MPASLTSFDKRKSGAGAVLRVGELVKRPLVDPTRFVRPRMAGPHLEDAFEHCSRRHHRPEGERLEQPGAVELAADRPIGGKDRLYFAGKEDTPAVFADV